MTARLANVTFDCHDALLVARFWSATLDRPLDPDPSEGFASIGGVGHDPATAPNYLFQRVPEKKDAKNRVHVDLVAPDRAAEIKRLIELGASRVRDVEEYGMQWTVLQDPEGNEFCLAEGT